MAPRSVRLPFPRRGRGSRPQRLALLVAALLSAVVSLAVPMCPRVDEAGRPLWQVETVHDGDTVTCRDETGRRQKIRLVGIDAPEQGQAYGGAARRALAEKLAGGSVRVTGSARDQHGRLLGRLWIDQRDLNRELVAEGWAWAFGGFSADDDLVAAESRARRERRGLWADDHPLPPRQWRAAHPRNGGEGAD